MPVIRFHGIAGYFPPDFLRNSLGGLSHYFQTSDNGIDRLFVPDECIEIESSRELLRFQKADENIGQVVAITSRHANTASARTARPISGFSAFFDTRSTLLPRRSLRSSSSSRNLKSPIGGSNSTSTSISLCPCVSSRATEPKMPMVFTLYRAASSGFVARRI